jgi:hypothetical protein
MRRTGWSRSKQRCVSELGRALIVARHRTKYTRGDIRITRNVLCGCLDTCRLMIRYRLFPLPAQTGDPRYRGNRAGIGGEPDAPEPHLGDRGDSRI